MAKEDYHEGLSPTVFQVIEQFAAAMRADDGVEGHAINRLENLLRKGSVPKPDETNEAFFELELTRFRGYFTLRKGGIHDATNTKIVFSRLQTTDD